MSKKRIAISEKSIYLLIWLGMLIFVVGFFGYKAKADDAPFPEAGIVQFITSTYLLWIVLGVVLMISMLLLGIWKHNNGRISKITIVPYLFVLPAMIFLIVFTVYPLLNLFYLSVFKGSIIRPTKLFVGLDNFQQLLAGVEFRSAIMNTAIYTFSAMIFLLFFALLFAVWFNKGRKIDIAGQTLIFMPHLIATVSVAYVWAWIMNPNPYGVLNRLLGVFGIPSVHWLENSKTALICIVVVNVWKSVGYYSLMILSSMKSIPTEIYEAAELDSASKIKTFFKITIPMLTPQLFFLLITITIGSFKVFDSVSVMTNGGPGRSTDVIARLIYDYACNRSSMLGSAAALSLVLVVIMSVLSYVYFHFLEKKVFYQ